jgi:hypothetical protein
MKLVNQSQNQKKIKKNQKSSIERIHAHELSIQDKDLVNCLYGDCYEDLDFKIKSLQAKQKCYARVLHYYFTYKYKKVFRSTICTNNYTL